MKISLAIRKVFLNTTYRMSTLIENYNCSDKKTKLKKEHLLQIIEVAIFEEKISFKTNIAKQLFIKSVLRTLRKEYNFYLSFFIPSINERIFI